LISDGTLGGLLSSTFSPEAEDTSIVGGDALLVTVGGKVSLVRDCVFEGRWLLSSAGGAIYRVSAVNFTSPSGGNVVRLEGDTRTIFERVFLQAPSSLATGTTPGKNLMSVAGESSVVVLDSHFSGGGGDEWSGITVGAQASFRCSGCEFSAFNSLRVLDVGGVVVMDSALFTACNPSTGFLLRVNASSLENHGGALVRNLEGVVTTPSPGTGGGGSQAVALAAGPDGKEGGLANCSTALPGDYPFGLTGVCGSGATCQAIRGEGIECSCQDNTSWGDPIQTCNSDPPSLTVSPSFLRVEAMKARKWAGGSTEDDGIHANVTLSTAVLADPGSVMDRASGVATAFAIQQANVPGEMGIVWKVSPSEGILLVGEEQTITLTASSRGFQAGTRFSVEFEVVYRPTTTCSYTGSANCSSTWSNHIPRPSSISTSTPLTPWSLSSYFTVEVFITALADASQTRVSVQGGDVVAFDKPVSIIIV
ncbi:unnamed protein product, partial [Discosporangium mesarthrocarpum]